MIRYILLALAIMLTPSAFAQNAAPNPCQNIAEATRGKEYHEINTLLESCRAKTPTLNVSSEEASEWSSAAKEFAGAIGIAAKELGVAVNDFLDSPAGILLAVILILNYGGGLVIGLPVTFASFAFMGWLYHRILTGKVEYQMVPVLWGAFHIRRKVSTQRVQEIGDGAGGIFLLSGILLFILNVIVWISVG